ncbi:MAG TPA: transglutaminase domain-containing protein, partial [Fibrobacteraceae bacterium]|nr:transglutaminase domain-containing protein [Fibrobacteraceae bacterium]
VPWDSVQQRAWHWAAENRLDLALQVLDSVGSVPDSVTASQYCYARSLFYSALGRDDSAEAEVFRGYALHPDPGDLLLYFNALLRPLREQDPDFTDPLQTIFRDLENHHPGHPLRTELATELIASRIGQASSDSLSRQMDRLGLVREWSWIGPFENISAFGMRHVLPPEQGMSPKAVLVGKSGLSVRWHDLHDASPDGWIRVDNLQGLDNALNYFSTDVLAKKAGPAILSFGASGSFVVWVNGARVLDEPLFRNLGVTGLRVRVDLRAGSNQIVVKLGGEQEPSVNFIVSLTDTTGLPLILPSKAKPCEQKLSVARVDSSRILPSPWVDRFSKHRGASSEENFANAMRQAIYWLQNDGFAQARMILDHLAQIKPRSGWVACLRAQLYDREDKGSLADQNYQTARRLDSSLADVWSYEFGKSVAREEWTTAARVFEARPKRLYLQPAQIFAAIKAYLALSQDTGAWAWVDTLALGRVNRPDAWIYASGVHAAIGDRKQAVDLLLRAGDRILSMPGVLNELVDRYRSLGDLQSAADLLRARLRISPDSPRDWVNLVAVLFQNKQWDELISSADSGLAHNPYVLKLWALQARALEMRGHKGDASLAAKAYLRALALPGADFDFGERVADLRGQPTLKDLRRHWPLDSLVAEGNRWQETEGLHSVILLSQRSLFWHSWGGEEQYVRLVVEVRNSKGVDQWKELDAANHFWQGDVEVERAVTHKRDGRTLEADISGTSIVFQSLEPGDRLEMEAVGRTLRDGPLSGEVWTEQYLGSSVPVLHSFLEVFCADSAMGKLRDRVTGIQIRPRTDRVRGLSHRIWETDHRMGYADEIDMPSWGDVLPQVVVSSLRSWQEVSDWYAALSDGKAVPSPELRALADSLFAGASDATDKVRRVQDLIVRYVRYSHQPFRQSGYIPQNATKTWLTRIGDCKDMAVLGKTLLELAGVRSRLVLVNTNDLERQATLPMDQFNHCILWVDLGPGVYVDFTADQNGAFALPHMDQQALALRIGAQSQDSILNIPFATANETMSRESWDTLCDDGSLVRDLRSVRGGNFAADFRADFRQERPGRIREL